MIKGEDLKFDNSVGWKQCYQSGSSKKPCRLCPYTFGRTKEVIENNALSQRIGSWETANPDAVVELKDLKEQLANLRKILNPEPKVKVVKKPKAPEKVVKKEKVAKKSIQEAHESH